MWKAKIAFLTAILLASIAQSQELPTPTPNDDDSASVKSIQDTSCMKACQADGEDALECESTCMQTAKIDWNDRIKLSLRGAAEAISLR